MATSAAGDTAVHPSGHLQDFIRAEVGAVQHVSTVLHEVAVTRVVDHDRVEAWDVQCRLSSGRHREEVRLGNLALEKRSQTRIGSPP